MMVCVQNVQCVSHRFLSEKSCGHYLACIASIQSASIVGSRVVAQVPRLAQCAIVSLTCERSAWALCGIRSVDGQFVYSPF
mmetsp:Transcript_123016/g.192167  ORF Transcript_123016/g.192167 Transcript_123016/m.192167 type:complete len:81 (+) Transcript_123016:848-1090(+)